jgi:hypothetical protein
MAKFQVTFEDRKGRKSQMVIEDASQNGARETAGFFRASRGDVKKVEPVKA